MLNPYVMSELRRAERVFRKRGQPNLAATTSYERGKLCDTRFPDETEAVRLIGLANGAPIHG